MSNLLFAIYIEECILLYKEKIYINFYTYILTDKIFISKVFGKSYETPIISQKQVKTIYVHYFICQCLNISLDVYTILCDY